MNVKSSNRVIYEKGGGELCQTYLLSFFKMDFTIKHSLLEIRKGGAFMAAKFLIFAKIGVIIRLQLSIGVKRGIFSLPENTQG